MEDNLKSAQTEDLHGWLFERIYESYPRPVEQLLGNQRLSFPLGSNQMLAVARSLAIDLKLLPLGGLRGVNYFDS
jgi:ABC-type branched-subunit amino acid transport system ATPase component